MKKLLLLLTFAFTLTANAQEEKTVTLVVSGQGKTQDEAKQNALRSAIEQAFGTFISSKTEILNDRMDADRIASVSSGNIKSYETLNVSQLPNGNWGATLKAIVSVDKLVSFVQSKGIAIEIQGGLFALNIKQQLLNEEGELIATCEMVGVINEILQNSFDFYLESSMPKSLDNESSLWEISLTVTAKANKNIDFSASYLIKNLKGICMTPQEIENYKSLNKKIHPFSINYLGAKNEFSFRNEKSVRILSSILSQWEKYVSGFTIESGSDKVNYSNACNLFADNLKESFQSLVGFNLNFPQEGQIVGIFNVIDRKNLKDIEKTFGYNVISIGRRILLNHLKDHNSCFMDADSSSFIYSRVCSNPSELPEYKFGIQNLYKMIGTRIRYPSEAREIGITGKCYAKCLISSDGKVEDLFIKRGVPGCYDCDREVIRVFKSLPNIKPAKNQKGEGVDAWLELPPISFTIH